jgi:hypothetical protein
MILVDHSDALAWINRDNVDALIIVTVEMVAIAEITEKADTTKVVETTKVVDTTKVVETTKVISHRWGCRHGK